MDKELKISKAAEYYITDQIGKVMKNRNYKSAYEWALKDAKERNITQNEDFFPYIFALDIRGERAEKFIESVKNLEVAPDTNKG